MENHVNVNCRLKGQDVNIQTMARMAYSEASAPTRTERGTEFEVFAKITRAIKSAEAKGKPAFNALAQAVLENRRLWTILASDVADPGNSLPEDLRARILYLAEFTNLHSSKVLNKTVSAQVLVELNTAMMRGLGQGVGR